LGGIGIFIFDYGGCKGVGGEKRGRGRGGGFSPPPPMEKEKSIINWEHNFLYTTE